MFFYVFFFLFYVQYVLRCERPSCPFAVIHEIHVIQKRNSAIAYNARSV